MWCRWGHGQCQPVLGCLTWLGGTRWSSVGRVAELLLLPRPRNVLQGQLVHTRQHATQPSPASSDILSAVNWCTSFTGCTRGTSANKCKYNLRFVAFHINVLKLLKCQIYPFVCQSAMKIPIQFLHSSLLSATCMLYDQIFVSAFYSYLTVTPLHLVIINILGAVQTVQIANCPKIVLARPGSLLYLTKDVSQMSRPNHRARGQMSACHRPRVAGWRPSRLF